MAKKKLKDHISGVAQGNLNALEPLLGIDANKLKDALNNPQVLAELSDLQPEAQFWIKNAEKIQQLVQNVAAGTAAETQTLALLASLANQAGKPIVSAKYKAALEQKKFENFLTETKQKAAAQFGQEAARHTTTMAFQNHQQQLQEATFRAQVQVRFNALQRQSAATNKKLLDQNQLITAETALQLGSNSPSLPAPTTIPQLGALPSVNFDSSGVGGISTTATNKGIFGGIGRAVSGFISGFRQFFGM